MLARRIEVPFDFAPFKAKLSFGYVVEVLVGFVLWHWLIDALVKERTIVALITVRINNFVGFQGIKNQYQVLEC